MIVGFLNLSSHSQNTPSSKDSIKSTKVLVDSINSKVVLQDTLPEPGVAVSPSVLRFNVKPGLTQTKTIKITNDTKKSYNFQIGFQDSGAGADGVTEVAVDKYSMFALSKYVIVSPTLIELKPRQSKTLTITLDIPAGDSMAISMWTTLFLDQMFERAKLEVPNPSSTTIALGITNGISFGINIYQNPPNVTINSVDIVAMNYESTKKQIYMKAKNTGTGIGYCLYYLELTNLITGKVSKLKVKQFPILPGFSKELIFDLPRDIEKGPYSALGVLDFGNKEELHTAEMEFKIK